MALSNERFDDAEAGFAGADRLATHAVVARHDEFADALAGTVLTATAPLLYTPGEGVPAIVLDELGRVLADGGTVYLLGGTSAVSDAAAQQLVDAGYDVRRLAGASRVETAVAVAEEAVTRGSVAQVVIARAFGPADTPTAAWADSVTVGGHAAQTGTPVLLTGAPLHPAVREWLDAHPGLEQVVVGGESAVPATVLADLDGGRRVSGAERAATAAAIADQLWADPARVRVLINGYHDQGWARGLLAAGVAADADAPILVTQADSLPPATRTALESCVAEELVLLGAEDLISGEVASALTAVVDACG